MQESWRPGGKHQVPNHAPINQFDSALFEKTVDRVLIYKSTARLLLTNGQALHAL